ncbi:MAG: TPM domain-containing protein, partial [Lentisphaeria bacterium]|nr:TPM domain-containing protein [Lentisphaeria bacterium]
VLIGYVGLKNGGKYRAASLKSNPEVAAEFRRRSGSEPELKLVDLNEESAKWTHAAALKIAAMVFGVQVGVLCAFSAFAGPVSKDPAYAVPAATGNSVRVGRIDDRAGVFGEDERRQLAALIAKVERSTGGEIGILTVKTLGGQSLEEFSLNAATRWKLGKAGKDNGAMLLLAIRECRNRLEIGYGWEGRINDAKAGDMLRSIVPELRAGKYAAGAAKVVSAIERAVLDLPDPAEFSRLVDDRAMVFTEKERRGIVRGLAKVAQATGGGRVGIVTVRSTGGQPMREFAIRNAPAGTLGRSADRGGAVLLLAVDDKAVHLEISPRWAQAVDRRYAEALLRVVNKDFAAGKYALGAVKTALVIRDKVLKAGAAANIPTVTAFSDIPVKAPVRDPRVADDSGTWAGLFGIFGVLAGFVLGYWGRLVATSVPRMYIYDPTMVRDSSSSSDSDYGSGSSGSSSSSGSSDSGGGGSFGGGGASGGW